MGRCYGVFTDTIPYVRRKTCIPTIEERLRIDSIVSPGMCWVGATLNLCGLHHHRIDHSKSWPLAGSHINGIGIFFESGNAAFALVRCQQANTFTGS